MLNAEHASPGATCGCAPPPCGNEQTCVGSGLAGTATSAGALSPQQQAGHAAHAQQTFSVSPRTGLNTPGRTAGAGRHRPSLRSGESLLVPDNKKHSQRHTAVCGRPCGHWTSVLGAFRVVRGAAVLLPCPLSFAGPPGRCVLSFSYCAEKAV